MPRQIRFEFVDDIEKLACRREVTNIPKDICLSTDGFIRFRQHARATVANDFMHHCTSKRVTGNARERVRTTALQRDTQTAKWFLGPRERCNILCKTTNDLLTLCQTGSKSTGQRKKPMRHMLKWIVVCKHEVLEAFIRDRFDSVIHRQYCANVGMNDKTCQGS